MDGCLKIILFKLIFQEGAEFASSQVYAELSREKQTFARSLTDKRSLFNSPLQSRRKWPEFEARLWPTHKYSISQSAIDEMVGCKVF